ncbi:hypothetical protein A2671_01475 [Candidatus Kaiserbacteria bacterium RIFCSPHIGHO2_01_FULL_49_13]|uniref:AI-2E family transporter n=1 Tax=Candidatus Kaiserbacteria bacterium RIFCSPHIGHO2_01_FULL_49_13 TaxID=1798477 RepID=A0A1F6CDR5_9BACT|nr:MAG: hypothetical protein A2671_01475 [Candidatus Kaiserbacteria bacterium RIFCSPHIGHO2_01_FULL_49_13]
MENRTMMVQITTGTVVKIILILILVALLFFLRDLVLIVLTAIVIASAIEPAVRFFTRYHIPRIAGVLLVYLTVIFALLGVFYFFMPPVLSDLSNFLGILPQYLDTFEASNPLTNNSFFPLVSNQLGDSFSLRDIIEGVRISVSNVSEGLFKTVSTVFGGLLSFILIVVFSFYFAMQETGVDDFLRVITPLKHQDYVIGLWRRSQQKIGLWMQGQVLLALIVGVLVYLGLTILGVKYSLVLAIIAALFELIPVFGPILSAIPAVVIAVGTGGTSLGILVVGLYVIIQQFENHLIYPLVVTKVVGVPPLLVILALLIGAKLAGFLGIILSVPTAAALQEFVNDLQRRRHLERSARP